MSGNSAVHRKRTRQRRLVELLLQAAVFVVLVGSWELFTSRGWMDPFFFGQPSAICVQIWVWITEGTSIGPLWLNMAVTLEEAILAFFIGVATGIVAGFVLGRSRLMAVVFGPYISMFNSIPRIVLAPIFIIWLGLGIKSKVALGVTLVFFAVFFNVFQGVREVDRNVVNNARILGASERDLIWHVQLPSALSWIITSLHSAFGLALVGAVVGEFMGATRGIGYLIATAKGAFDNNAVFAAMIILSVTAIVADWLVTTLERRLTVWRPAAASERAA